MSGCQKYQLFLLGAKEANATRMMRVVVVSSVLNTPATCKLYPTDGSALTAVWTDTDREVADQNCYLAQSQYMDTGPTRPSTDPVPPGT